MKLTNRLLAAANFIEPCVCLADIGTDHAYLPAYCLLNGLCQYAIAADIREKPLANARKTLAACGLIEQVELRLSDGLRNFSPNEVSQIAIAGMGGNQIADMITETPWLQADGVHLILQPMTHFEDVRRALLENGFSIEQETVATEGERLYLVMSARYCGECRSCSDAYAYAGTLPQSKEPQALAFLQKTLERLRKRALALETRDTLEAARLKKTVEEIENAG